MYFIASRTALGPTQPAIPGGKAAGVWSWLFTSI